MYLSLVIDLFLEVDGMVSNVAEVGEKWSTNLTKGTKG